MPSTHSRESPRRVARIHSRARRRFDLLRPHLQLAPSTLLKNRYVAPSVSGALDGLWRAPAIADDSVLVRDWLVPATTDDGKTAWDERGQCAEMLALRLPVSRRPRTRAR